MKQKGFTLIELVVVIVILGILAATALPKFVDLGSDARRSVMQTVEGSMRSANSMIYAKAATGNQLGASGSVSVNTETVATAYGFASNVVELRKVMDLTTDVETDGTTTLRHRGAPTPATCAVVYAPATSMSAPATYTPDFSGC